MKKIVLLTYVVIIVASIMYANDNTGAQLPSEAYYQEHIETLPPAEAPSLRAGDDDLDPGGSASGPGGWVGSPVSAPSVLVVIVTAAAYVTVRTVKSKRK